MSKIQMKTKPVEQKKNAGQKKAVEQKKPAAQAKKTDGKSGCCC